MYSRYYVRSTLFFPFFNRLGGEPVILLFFTFTLSQSTTELQLFHLVETTQLCIINVYIKTGKSCCWGGISTFDLLVQTSLDELPFNIESIIYFFTKQATLTRRSTVLSPSPSVGIPCSIFLQARVRLGQSEQIRVL